jgi:N-acetylmuramoyl-L-alanine amidase
MNLAVLDIQHRSKPGHWRDRGAVAFGVEEVDLTHRYAIAADRELRRLGWDCCILADGAYSERWARADAYGARVYVACHVDAGGGDRGTVYYDARSSKGPALAEAVAVELRTVVPWPVKATPARPDSDGRPGNEGEAPYACIRGVGAVAICCEPGFIDNPVEAHRRHLVGAIEVVGIALARGIVAWGKGR